MKTADFADLAESFGDELHCRTDADPEAWFAEPLSSRQGRAKAACQGCPLLEQCRDYALEEGIPDGVWGGLDERDRKAYWAANGGKPTRFLDEIDAALAPKSAEPDRLAGIIAASAGMYQYADEDPSGETPGEAA